MNNLLTKFLDKSFSKLASNCTVTNAMVAHVVQTAAMAQDFLETSARKLGDKPNADIIFKRIKECDFDKLKFAFLFILGFMILNVKQKFNFREWTLAIDTHYESFYGSYNDLWVHAYKPKGENDCTGSYCYITIAVVVGQAKFTLLALPVHLGQDKAELVEELITVAKKYFKIKLVLLDRGFDSGAVTRKLKQSNIKHIIFAKRNTKIKKFLEQTPSFGHKYFHDKIEWDEDKSTQKEPTKYLIIKDYIDLKKFLIYDWAFITNCSNIKALSYVHLYMKRWCIENIYKQLNAFKIKTISTNYIIRYFLFLFRTLLYNLWKFYNIIMNINITFKEFVFTLFLANLNIKHITTCKQQIEKFNNILPTIK